jgi:hypothetical protein
MDTVYFAFAQSVAIFFMALLFVSLLITGILFVCLFITGILGLFWPRLLDLSSIDNF